MLVRDKINVFITLSRSSIILSNGQSLYCLEIFSRFSEAHCLHIGSTGQDRDMVGLQS